jgi:hypothetical protein
MPEPARLAELVSLLTGCEEAGAMHAVREQVSAGAPGERRHVVAKPEDPLALVARAMVMVDRPAPEGFRVAGYLRTDLPQATGLTRHGTSSLPRRRPRRRFDVFD